MSLLFPQIVAIYRPQQQAGKGALGYGGNTAALETVLASNVPACIAIATKTGKGPVGLPGDVMANWYELMIRPVAGLVILKSDVVIDDLGRRFIVAGTEPSAFGWHCTLIESET